jgi:hypothetical protein
MLGPNVQPYQAMYLQTRLTLKAQKTISVLFVI